MDLANLNAVNLATILAFSWHSRIQADPYTDDIGFYRSAEPYREYVFGLKPQNLNVIKPKIFGKKTTIDSALIEHWINDLQTFDFKGTTGNLEPLYPEMSNLKSSAIYQWFYQLDMFIQKHNQDILMLYEGINYWGYFNNFNFTENADSPFTIDYTFSFSVYPYDGGYKTESDIDSNDLYTRNASNSIEAVFDNSPQLIYVGNDQYYELSDRTSSESNSMKIQGAITLDSLWNKNKLGASDFMITDTQTAIRTDKG